MRGGRADLTKEVVVLPTIPHLSSPTASFIQVLPTYKAVAETLSVVLRI